MVFGNDKKAKKNNEDISNLEKRLENLEKVQSTENANLKSRINALEAKINDLERVNLEQGQDLDEFKDIVQFQREELDEFHEICRDLELKNDDFEEKYKLQEEKLSAVRRKQQQDLDQLFKVIENVSVLHQKTSENLENFSQEASDQAALVRKGVEDLCQTVMEMSEQDQSRMQGLEQSAKSHLQTSLAFLTATSDALNVKSQDLLRIQSRVNEMSNMLPHICQKILKMQELDSNAIKEDILGLKKKLNSKMDSLKEEAMKSDKNFEQRFSALTHATKAKMENAIGFKISQRLKVQKTGANISMYQIPFKESRTLKSNYRDNTVARLLDLDKSHKKGMMSSKLIDSSWIDSSAIVKTILLVGITGAGKSTFIDALANFLFNVRFEDRHRFNMINLTKKEQQKKNNQALSQTDDITFYRIPYINGFNVNFALNIIDTPGVGDTRGKKRDDLLLEQLETLFSSNVGISKLDAVCFVVPAGHARLEPQQQYIFDKIITGFGKDMKNNFLGIFTHDDDAPPEAVSAFQQAKIGLASYFRFNSKYVLTDKKVGGKVEKSILQTPDGNACIQFQNFYDNCEKFLGTLLNMKPVSTAKTAEVMKTRKNIDFKINDLHYEIRKLLGKRETLSAEKKIMEKFMNDEKTHKDYKYKVTEEKAETEKLPEGHFVTNCTTCNRTCHDDCQIKDDHNKHYCLAMDKNTRGDPSKASCTVCSQRCFWKEHVNMPYKYVIRREEVEKTFDDVKKKYEEVLGHQADQKKVIETIERQEKQISDQIQAFVNEVRQCIVYLDNIALKTAATDSATYIQLMIDNEERNQMPGFRERIRELEEEKKRAELLDNVVFGGQLVDGIDVSGVRQNADEGFEAEEATMSKRFRGYDRHEAEMAEKYNFVPSQVEQSEVTDELQEEYLRHKDDLLRTAAQGNTLENVNGHDFQDLNEALLRQQLSFAAPKAETNKRTDSQAVSSIKDAMSRTQVGKELRKVMKNKNAATGRASEKARFQIAHAPHANYSFQFREPREEKESLDENNSAAAKLSPQFQKVSNDELNANENMRKVKATTFPQEVKNEENEETTATNASLEVNDPAAKTSNTKIDDTNDLINLEKKGTATANSSSNVEETSNEMHDAQHRIDLENNKRDASQFQETSKDDVNTKRSLPDLEKNVDAISFKADSKKLNNDNAGSVIVKSTNATKDEKVKTGDTDSINAGDHDSDEHTDVKQEETQETCDNNDQDVNDNASTVETNSDEDDDSGDDDFVEGISGDVSNLILDGTDCTDVFEHIMIALDQLVNIDRNELEEAILFEEFESEEHKKILLASMARTHDLVQRRMQEQPNISNISILKTLVEDLKHRDKRFLANKIVENLIKASFEETHAETMIIAFRQGDIDVFQIISKCS